ncbi:hypothetical protein JCM19046_461 [Bacillus sp. JCM 19046]|nr:hypothetical protein JCM19045_2623 [Bacillus sp. JCM 19045]GAF16055.1 hypothetical protein JCM19046_461 [Bacillus sp. JCM 19046]
MIDSLKKQFGWKSADFNEEGFIQTDVGLKRISNWNDKALLEWHIQWRDECNVTPYIIMDRMIRTKAGKPFVELEGSFTTVHDVIQQESEQRGLEKHWGVYIGKTISLGRKQKQKKEMEIREFSKLTSLFPQVTVEEKKQLSGFIAEADKRMKRAEKIIKEAEQQLPVMDYFHTDGKQVVTMLLINGSQQKPVPGFHSLMTFLREWHKENGEDSLHQLLNYIDEKALLTDDEKKWMIAEALVVDELKPFLLAVETEEAVDVPGFLTEVSDEWDQSKRFIASFATWLDRKKVIS